MKLLEVGKSYDRNGERLIHIGMRASGRHDFALYLPNHDSWIFIGMSQLCALALKEWEDPLAKPKVKMWKWIYESHKGAWRETNRYYPDAKTASAASCGDDRIQRLDDTEEMREVGE